MWDTSLPAPRGVCPYPPILGVSLPTHVGCVPTHPMWGTFSPTHVGYILTYPMWGTSHVFLKDFHNLSFCSDRDSTVCLCTCLRMCTYVCIMYNMFMYVHTVCSIRTYHKHVRVLFSLLLQSVLPFLRRQQGWSRSHQCPHVDLLQWPRRSVPRTSQSQPRADTAHILRCPISHTLTHTYYCSTLDCHTDAPTHTLLSTYCVHMYVYDVHVHTVTPMLVCIHVYKHMYAYKYENHIRSHWYVCTLAHNSSMYIYVPALTHTHTPLTLCMSYNAEESVFLILFRNGVPFGDGSAIWSAQHPPVHGPLVAQHRTGGGSLPQQPIRSGPHLRGLSCSQQRGGRVTHW